VARSDHMVLEMPGQFAAGDAEFVERALRHRLSR
jgi:hypothetical protein